MRRFLLTAALFGGFVGCSNSSEKPKADTPAATPPASSNTTAASSANQNTITKEKVDKLKEDMPLDEVVKLLGDNHTSTQPPQMITGGEQPYELAYYRWSNEDETGVATVFHDKKLAVWTTEGDLK